MGGAQKQKLQYNRKIKSGKLQNIIEIFENGGNLKKKELDKIGAPINKNEFTKGGMGNSNLVKDSTTRENQTVLKKKKKKKKKKFEKKNLKKNLKKKFEKKIEKKNL